jgi:hypothetical protein
MTTPDTQRKPLLQIYMDEALKDAVKRAADRERMTMTTWAIQALINYLPVDLAEAIERP